MPLHIKCISIHGTLNPTGIQFLQLDAALARSQHCCLQATWAQPLCLDLSLSLIGESGALARVPAALQLGFHPPP
jgi:hypothetical protein